MQSKDNKQNILIFAGTTEGRNLARALAAAGRSCLVSVATDYGNALMEPDERIRVLQGRKNAAQMAEMIENEKIDTVIDATHPFATEVTAQIREACEQTGTRYYRLSRDTARVEEVSSDIIYVDSMEEAVSVLEEVSGEILVLTGSKQLPLICERLSDPSRIYARVLPSMESLEICRDCGLQPSHILAMQGPFTTEMNVAMIHQIDAKIMLTKESGVTGGYSEKIEAAKACGIPVVVIRNPEKVQQTEGLSYDEMLRALGIEMSSEKAAVQSANRSMMIAGLGPGTERAMTIETKQYLDEAEVIFGDASVLAKLGETKALQMPMYQSSKILDYWRAHPEFVRGVALFSGDTGLYSGAGLLKTAFEGEKDTQIHMLPAISSLSYLASRIGRPYQNVKILSTHGRTCNVAGHLKQEKQIYLFTSGAEDVRRIAEEIAEIENVRIASGYQLALEDEEIIWHDAKSLAAVEKEGLYLLYLEHDREASQLPGISDQDFIRGKVPMTKEEIRALSICKLQLTKDSIFYDIGAGTGSISIEAARSFPDLQIYAIEKNEAALELIAQNKAHFYASNVTIVEGTAPQALDGLPAPTHVFLGGSGKQMKEILETVIAANPEVCIVANFVTIENTASFLAIAKDLDCKAITVSQVQVSRAEEVGSYHLMKAQNPVTIIRCFGPEENDE